MPRCISVTISCSIMTTMLAYESILVVSIGIISPGLCGSNVVFSVARDSDWRIWAMKLESKVTLLCYLPWWIKLLARKLLRMTETTPICCHITISICWGYTGNSGIKRCNFQLYCSPSTVTCRSKRMPLTRDILTLSSLRLSNNTHRVP